jgi:hypothetical protein
LPTSWNSAANPNSLSFFLGRPNLAPSETESMHTLTEWAKVYSSKFLMEVRLIRLDSFWMSWSIRNWMARLLLTVLMLRPLLADSMLSWATDRVLKNLFLASFF